MTLELVAMQLVEYRKYRAGDKQYRHIIAVATLNL